MSSVNCRSVESFQFFHSVKTGVHKFSKLYEPLQNYRHKIGYIKFHTQDPKRLGAIIQNLIARATRRPGFVHLWVKSANLYCGGCEFVSLVEITERKKEFVCYFVHIVQLLYFFWFIVPGLISSVTQNGNQGMHCLHRSVYCLSGTAVIGDFSFLRPEQFFLRYVGIIKVDVDVSVSLTVAVVTQQKVKIRA